MMEAGLRRVTESGAFTWPWSAARGLAVISGAAGGGGGGGGAFCMQGLNLHGAAGGDGGDGGAATTVQIGQRRYVAFGGNGGGGGSGGGITRDGKPLHGNNGQGCNFGRSDGGKGARADETDDRVVANAETVEEVVPEKPSSSNYQSCRSETYFRLLSAKAEAVVAAVQDSKADAMVPAGSMDTFFSSRFTTNRTPSCERFSGCSGWFAWRTG